ncbi:alkane 1-monooxygenase [Candidatus Bathyarchaeota archaeon]|nr:alkane 1-monooxygenase [Candidatus Bathyarchaeota archaeon]
MSGIVINHYHCIVSMRALPFTIVYLVPASVVIGYLLGSWFTFLTPVFVFLIVPLLDHAIGVDASNPPVDEEKKLANMNKFRFITMMSMPIVVAIVAWGAWVIATGALSWLEGVGFTISVGVNGGVLGINASHELQHRVNLKVEPALARILLLSVLYMHWSIEHVTRHHRYVATPRDPATAPLHQGFYRFWFRTVMGGFKGAWMFERGRHENLAPVKRLFKNRVFLYSLMEIMVITMIWQVLGWQSVLFLVIQAFIAVSLLEVINYIEHYGLVRKTKPDGTYDRVRPEHSWNSSHRLTNYFLFNLQRHSDHHFRPNRRYQILRHQDDAPQLPTGYAGMVLIALVPPLWKRIMHARMDVPRSPDA